MNYYTITIGITVTIAGAEVNSAADAGRYAHDKSANRPLRSRRKVERLGQTREERRRTPPDVRVFGYIG